MPKLAALFAIALLAVSCSGGFDFEAVDEAAEASGLDAPSPSAGSSSTADQTNPELEPVEGPKLGDHWHSAFAVYLCDVFLPPLDSQADPDGIHSHADGLIHIHPFTDEVTGRRATMGVFFEAMYVTAEDDAVTFGNGTRIANGEDCDGEPGQWQIGYWPDVEAGQITFTRDLNDILFRGNFELFTLAFVPIGADIPQPPNAE